MPKEHFCPITGKAMVPVFNARILGKYDVQYYHQIDSGLLQTEPPFWLDEAYVDAIAETDTGLIARNVSNRGKLEPILALLFDGSGRFLDVGGGYGLLTRLMRDAGFDCYSTDAYCKNLFASRFEPDEGFKANALFAFEVFEHIGNPLTFLEEHFARYGCKTIVFSTLVYEGQVPAQDWWYYAFETGQHISFYQPKTLSLLANRVGCNYYALSPELHLITDHALSKRDVALLTNKKKLKRFAASVRQRRKKLSKTWDDHLLIKRELIRAQSGSR